MTQKPDGLVYDEEPDSETIALDVFKASEGLKDLRHLSIRDSDAGIVDIDTDI